MTKNATSPVIHPFDLLVAGALLSRLPWPHAPDTAFARQAQATWAYPVIGALLALLAAAVWTGSNALGLPIPITAALTLASVSLMTGALHEDGLADMFDGLWGGHDPSRRLEIMKDSAIGSYGVLALIAVFAVKWSAVCDAGITALAAAMCLSRAVLPAMMHLAPQARKNGLAAKVGPPPAVTALIALMLGLAIACGLIGLAQAVLAVLVATATALLVALIAYRKIGGITGDILGAAQQLSETTLLLALLATAAD